MRKLPSYRNPPVVEVSVGVQFDPIDWLIAPRLGLVWERFKDEFPELEQHPPLQPQIERLGLRQPKGVVNLQIRGADVTPRIWMLNKEGSELIQVQPDRFHRNWRKHRDRDRKYPRYTEHIQPTFLSSLQRFRQLLIDHGVSDIKVRQCELTYVNHITMDGAWRDHRDFEKVFRFWNGSFAASWGDRMENAAVVMRKILRDQAGEFVGRLHVQIEPAFLVPDLPQRHEEEQVFALTLTARGKPLVEDDSGVVRFLDLGHDEIVTTFDEVTTETMHSVWGKM